ncbi:hypothetical protein D6764_05715 [Candidatus Woesearchaeota archaeon]|nr:MAG: hypothetical protein D6764_05715 [Candidatus Woesearchaeota archaeon]
MKVKIEENVEVPLLSRKNIRAKIEFEGPTPSRREVIEALASELGAKQELLVLHKIDTQFGSPEAVVFARLYDSEDAVKEFEPEHILKRVPAPKQEEAQEEAQAEKKEGAEGAESEGEQSPEGASESSGGDSSGDSAADKEQKSDGAGSDAEAPEKAGDE